MLDLELTSGLSMKDVLASKPDWKATHAGRVVTGLHHRAHSSRGCQRCNFWSTDVLACATHRFLLTSLSGEGT